MSAGEVKKEIVNIVTHNYPLCKKSDMPEEMKREAMEICVTAAEKFTNNYEYAAKLIKNNMDKKFGPPFHVVIGGAFSFSIDHEEKTLIHTYPDENITVLIWRTGFA